jgi:hypothetical protein
MKNIEESSRGKVGVTFTAQKLCNEGIHPLNFFFKKNTGRYFDELINAGILL